MSQQKVWHSTDETIRPNEGILCLFEDKNGNLHFGYFSEEADCFITRYTPNMNFAPSEVKRFALADDLISQEW